MKGNSNHKKLGSARLNVEAFKQAARQFSRPLPDAAGLNDADRFQTLVDQELPLVEFDPLTAGPLDGLGYHSNAAHNAMPPGDPHSVKAPDALRVPKRSRKALKKNGAGQSPMPTTPRDAVSLEKADRVVPKLPPQPVVRQETGRKQHSPARPENGRVPETSPQGQRAGDPPPKDRTMEAKAPPEGRSVPRKKKPANGVSHSSPFQPALRQLDDLSNALLAIKGGLSGGACQGNATPDNPENKADSSKPPLRKGSHGYGPKSYTPLKTLKQSASQVASSPVSASSNGPMYPKKTVHPSINTPGRDTPPYRFSSNVQSICKNHASTTRSIELIEPLVQHPPTGTNGSGPTAQKGPDGIRSPAALPPNLDRAKAPDGASATMKPRGTGVFPSHNPLSAGTAPKGSHFTAETLTDLINDVLRSQARRHGVDV